MTMLIDGASGGGGGDRQQGRPARGRAARRHRPVRRSRGPGAVQRESDDATVVPRHDRDPGLVVAEAQRRVGRRELDVNQCVRHGPVPYGGIRPTPAAKNSHGPGRGAHDAQPDPSTAQLVARREHSVAARASGPREQLRARPGDGRERARRQSLHRARRARPAATVARRAPRQAVETPRPRVIRTRYGIVVRCAGMTCRSAARRRVPERAPGGRDPQRDLHVAARHQLPTDAIREERTVRPARAVERSARFTPFPPADEAVDRRRVVTQHLLGERPPVAAVTPGALFDVCPEPRRPPKSRRTPPVRRCNAKPSARPATLVEHAVVVDETDHRRSWRRPRELLASDPGCVPSTGRDRDRARPRHDVRPPHGCRRRRCCRRRSRARPRAPEPAPPGRSTPGRASPRLYVQIATSSSGTRSRIVPATGPSPSGVVASPVTTASRVPAARTPRNGPVSPAGAARRLARLSPIDADGFRPLLQ